MTTSVWLFIGLAKKFIQGPNTQDFPCDSAGKESACSAGDLSWEYPLEKGKATPSCILAWRNPRTVQSVGSQRVGHNGVTFAHTHTHAHTHNTLVMVNKIKNVIYWKLTCHCKSTTLQLKTQKNIGSQLHGPHFRHLGASCDLWLPPWVVHPSPWKKVPT